MDDYDVDAVLQQALDRLTVLADVNTALAGTLSATEGLRRVARIAARRLGDWCAIDLLTAKGRIERVCVSRTPTGPPPREELVLLNPPPPPAAGPLARVLRGAGPLLLTGTDLTPDDADPWDKEQADLLTGAASAVLAPLRAHREVLGALTVTRTAQHPPFTEQDLPLIEDLVHRVGLAVENARLHYETRNIAERLQRSLLPDLPTTNGLQMAARYAPSHATAEVGGDWYDSFVLPAGHTTLIIGDVTGHDLKAAVTMSQLRNMLRGIACDRQEPTDKILHRMDLAQQTLYPGTTATCVYAILEGPEGGPWSLEYAVAGHPPPLLITRDGDTRYLDGGRSHLLGVTTRLPRTNAAETLPAGSTLLLYTDGLIERRGENIDHGFTRLRQHAAALAREDPDTLLDELLTGLAADTTDDVALLALRLPEGRPHGPAER
ncbi:serine phosphatase RsbU (regulator of sigma subunit) [Kitasatospora sp. SolWspMP-SS2h]|uniref:PP2C family protein-serine/threonine phosphatase n=1 Tax=Kitasatospora sp. SolWspMP-SS2h TaxID=1305729 RepID=UPI000DB9CC42|nr:GAF domain-containing SpoIIE family protein phosphatase [Kitasatospora sp. SolWspMP-SS2h]RAJ45330.1 serine phosphatase RsbU (regulator of sigma subunit) [Kitasatospora sp. SolWspMP-SS2h]